jgi:hypothetical protein
LLLVVAAVAHHRASEVVVAVLVVCLQVMRVLHLDRPILLLWVVVVR